MLLRLLIFMFFIGCLTAKANSQEQLDPATMNPVMRKIAKLKYEQNNFLVSGKLLQFLVIDRLASEMSLRAGADPRYDFNLFKSFTVNSNLTEMEVELRPYDDPRFLTRNEAVAVRNRSTLPELFARVRLADMEVVEIYLCYENKGECTKRKALRDKVEEDQDQKGKEEMERALEEWRKTQE